MSWLTDAMKDAARQAVDRVNKHSGPYRYPEDVDVWFDFVAEQWVAIVDNIEGAHADSPVEAFNKIASGP
jgi:hypothetical protein